MDGRGRCLVCRYDMSGSTSGVCPECGTDLRILRGAERGFVFDPPPRSVSLMRNPGALLGLLVLIGLPVSCVGYAVYQLVLGLAGGA